MTSVPLTLVCVPGTMCAPQIFDSLHALGHEVQVIAWNELPPPHDIDSLARIVSAAVTEASPAVLIGHSTGGVIALSAVLAGAAPRALVLLDTGADTRSHADIEAIIRRVRDEWGPELWRDHIVRSVTLSVDAAVRATLEQYPARTDPALVEQVLRSQHARDLTPDLPRIDVPTLVVHGTRDAARPLAHAHRLVAGIRDARLVELECGHTPTVELPAESAAAIGAFLAQP